MTPTDTQVGDQWGEKAVKVCPQCDGEGSYADGVDEAACSTDCTRCDGNGWIVDLHRFKSPLKMLVDDAWLARRIAADPDLPCEAGGGQQAAASPAEQVGIGAADEPKPSQHPIRGEGEPVEITNARDRLASRLARFAENPGGHWVWKPSDIEAVSRLIAHPPTSYEGEGLREAAQAVVDRWETPLWKDAEPTAHVIARLSQALQSASGK